MAYEAIVPAQPGVATRHRPEYQAQYLTFSRSYTVDVTYRCFRRCGYCEYRRDEGHLITLAEVDHHLAQASRLHCREVLIMAGEQPWRLPDLGLADEDTFVDLVEEICRRAMRRGLLPHTNVGLLSRSSLVRLQPWNASMGLMLETGTDSIRAHALGGGKRYRERLAHLEAAGELGIPFTTGILVRNGESEAHRRHALELIAGCHLRHHHIQEVIVQNFVPKPNTPMADQAAPDPDTVKATVELARALLPSDI